VGFAGVLQADGYGAYRELASGGAVELAFGFRLHCFVTGP
jgi:hypothetical protein